MNLHEITLRQNSIADRLERFGFTNARIYTGPQDDHLHRLSLVVSPSASKHKIKIDTRSDLLETNLMFWLGCMVRVFTDAHLPKAYSSKAISLDNVSALEKFFSSPLSNVSFDDVVLDPVFYARTETYSQLISNFEPHQARSVSAAFFSAKFSTTHEKVKELLRNAPPRAIARTATLTMAS
jgi:hypothetical protein